VNVPADKYSSNFMATILLLLMVSMAHPAVAEPVVIPATGSYSAGEGVDTSPAGADLPVIEHFRTYTGHRTIDGLTALFTRPAGRVVRQLPAIAISDGRTAVIIAARIDAKDGRAINFSLDGATLVSVRKLKEAEWEIKALPDRGALTMSLLVMNGTETATYPLVVAPLVPAATDLSLQGFQEFLDQSDSGGQPGRDLNGDGRRDYLDDYIYTANYLAKQQTTGRDKSARQQRALKRTLAVEPAPIKPEYDPNDFPD
jgi:hypothetical protein